MILFHGKKNRGMSGNKAIILATAKLIEADLLTDDWDDFQHIDEAVVIHSIKNSKL